MQIPLEVKGTVYKIKSSLNCFFGYIYNQQEGNIACLQVSFI